MMSIRQKGGYICVDKYNPFIDLWTHKKYPRGIKILKTYIMYMMYLSVFNFFICISEMDERCEKKSLVRELPMDCASRKM